MVQILDCEALGGMPFLKANGITIDTPRNLIIINDDVHIPYSQDTSGDQNHARTVLRATHQSVLLPEEFIDFHCFPDTSTDMDVLVEPVKFADPLWPYPELTRSISGHVRASNTTESPIPIGEPHKLLGGSTQVTTTNYAPAAP